MSRHRNLQPRASSAPQWPGPAIPGALSGPPLPSSAFGRRERRPYQRDRGPRRAVAPWVLVMVFFVVLVGLVSLIVAVAA